MIIAGFDSAPSAVAWAYGPPGGVPVRGTHKLPDYGDNTRRLKRYVRDWGKNFLKSAEVERAYVEAPFARRHGFNEPVYEKQQAVISALEDSAELVDLDIDDGFWTVEVGDWRKRFYAGRRPTKNAGEQWKSMALVECARRGWLITQVLNGAPDHNVAEACGIWFYGCYHADRRFRASADIDIRRQQSAADEARRGA